MNNHGGAVDVVEWGRVVPRVFFEFAAAIIDLLQEVGSAFVHMKMWTLLSPP